MNRLFLSLSLLAGFLALDGCYGRHTPEPPTTSDVYRPVYAAYAEIRNVQVRGPQPLRIAGKIYVKDDYLFVNDVGTGIHVIDNRDPARPVNLAFVSIPGNHELAVQDSTLYADNVLDLVALNIANPRNIRVVRRVENTFDYPAFPLATNVRFECANRDRGVVIRWERAKIDNPECYR